MGEPTQDPLEITAVADAYVEFYEELVADSERPCSDEAFVWEHASAPLMAAIKEQEDQELWLTFSDGQIRIMLNMNDTFAYASADCEEVDLLTFWRLYKQRRAGDTRAYVRYVAEKRGVRPLTPIPPLLEGERGEGS